MQSYRLIVDNDVNLVIDQTVLPLESVITHHDGVLAIDLPEQSILSAVAASDGVVQHPFDGQLSFSLDHQARSVLAEKIGKFGTEADYELLAVLVDARLNDFSHGRRCENFSWVPTRKIADAIEGADNTVHKRAQALRDRISKRAPHLCGLIESEQWSGFRLHPRATCLDTSEILSAQ